MQIDQITSGTIQLEVYIVTRLLIPEGFSAESPRADAEANALAYHTTLEEAKENFQQLIDIHLEREAKRVQTEKTEINIFYLNKLTLYKDSKVDNVCIMCYSIYDHIIKFFDKYTSSKQYMNSVNVVNSNIVINVNKKDNE
jgi:hypothetical protein